MTKVYDQAYFDNWYRKEQISSPATLARKVALAVAMAEYHLCRPIRSVLDVGCGEGAWRAPLLRLRPKLDYLGLDSSQYAVNRYGRQRNLRLVPFGDLEHLRLNQPADLLVCADVLHYLGDDELRRGLSGFTALCDGLAFIETYCSEDDIDGDLHDFQRRDAAWYRREFHRAGLVACGNHGYLVPAQANYATSLELPNSERKRRPGLFQRA